VRLGFSVAAHIHPEILLVDEILAVGDHRFQLKCFQWVKDFLRSEKTFFLVSHNMHHIESVCQRVLYIKAGRIAFDGPPEQAISHYMIDLSERDDDDVEALPGRKVVAGDFDITAIRILDSAGNPTESAEVNGPVRIELDYLAPNPVASPKIEIAFNCGTLRIGQTNTISDCAAPEALGGIGTVTFNMGSCPLMPNRYSIDIFVADGDSNADLIAWQHAASLNVLPPAGFRMASGKPGFIKIPASWGFAHT